MIGKTISDTARSLRRIVNNLIEDRINQISTVKYGQVRIVKPRYTNRQGKTFYVATIQIMTYSPEKDGNTDQAHVFQNVKVFFPFANSNGNFFGRELKVGDFGLLVSFDRFSEFSLNEKKEDYFGKGDAIRALEGLSNVFIPFDGVNKNLNIEGFLVKQDNTKFNIKNDEVLLDNKKISVELKDDKISIKNSVSSLKENLEKIVASLEKIDENLTNSLVAVWQVTGSSVTGGAITGVATNPQQYITIKPQLEEVKQLIEGLNS